MLKKVDQRIRVLECGVEIFCVFSYVYDKVMFFFRLD